MALALAEQRSISHCADGQGEESDCCSTQERPRILDAYCGRFESVLIQLMNDSCSLL